MSTISPSSTLADADDYVVRRQLAVFGGRTAGDHASHDRVAILLSQLGTDSIQVQAHLNLKVVQRSRRHVSRMGIVTGRDRRQEHLKQIVAVGLLPTACVPRVSSAQLLDRFIPFFPFIFQIEKRILDLTTPAIVELRSRSLRIWQPRDQ